MSSLTTTELMFSTAFSRSDSSAARAASGSVVFLPAAMSSAEFAVAGTAKNRVRATISNRCVLHGVSPNVIGFRVVFGLSRKLEQSLSRLVQTSFPRVYRNFLQLLKARAPFARYRQRRLADR